MVHDFAFAVEIHGSSQSILAKFLPPFAALCSFLQASLTVFSHAEQPVWHADCDSSGSHPLKPECVEGNVKSIP